MLTVDYWETEVTSFKKRLPGLDAARTRWLLRGLSVLATELSHDCPESTTKVMQDFQACLHQVEDSGISLDIETWLHSHASPEIENQIEHEFMHP